MIDHTAALKAGRISAADAFERFDGPVGVAEKSAADTYKIGCAFFQKTFELFSRGDASGENDGDCDGTPRGDAHVLEVAGFRVSWSHETVEAA